MVLIIGLTGLIGSGKSEAANCFEKLGAKIIDTDKIAHDLTKRGQEGLIQIIKQLGAGFLTQEGGLDRVLLREKVFESNTLRIKLEEVLHPLIYQQVVEEIKQADERYPYIVLVVPLLFKAPKFLELVNQAIYIHASLDTIIQRVQLRSNLSIEQIEAIINTQIMAETQKKLAADIIDNNSTLTNLYQQIKILNQKYVNYLKKNKT